MSAVESDVFECGHPRSGRNVMTVAERYDYCRACTNAANRRRYHARATYAVSERQPKPVRRLTRDEVDTVEQHIPLAKWAAGQFRKAMLFPADGDELRQDAYVGLAWAAQRYGERELRIAFSTFAVVVMRNHMREGLLLRSGRGKRYVWDSLGWLEDLAEQGAEVPASDRNPADEVVDADEVRRIWSWLQLDTALDHKDRALIEGLAHGVRGQALAVSAGLSRAQAHRRIAAIRQRLGAEL